MHRPADVRPLSFTVEDSKTLYNASESLDISHAILTVPDRPRNPSPALILDEEDEVEEEVEEEASKQLLRLDRRDGETKALSSPLAILVVVKPVPVRLPPWEEEKWEDENEGDDDEEPRLGRGTATGIPSIVFPTSAQALQSARDGLLLALSATGGNTDGHPFRQCLTTLHQYYRQTRMDVRTTNASSGTWLTLTKPIFADCLGQNDQGDPLYTLSRMSFDMFRPSDLICSLQGNFNCVEPVQTGVPPVLQADVHQDDASFCTYNGVCAFTLERPLPSFPNAPNAHLKRQCRGILSTQGYIVADPDTPNRHTVWITEGNMHANDAPQDTQVWKDFFTAQLETVPSKAQSLARQLRRSSGSVDHRVDSESRQQSYRFRRPLGGHGLAYVDTLYVDQSLRIIRGHRGTLFVFSKIMGN